MGANSAEKSNSEPIMNTGSVSHSFSSLTLSILLLIVTSAGNSNWARGRNSMAFTEVQIPVVDMANNIAFKQFLGDKNVIWRTLL